MDEHALYGFCDEMEKSGKSIAGLKALLPGAKARMHGLRALRVR